MKNEMDLSLLARQWGATAVPFGLVNPNDWLDTPGAQKALSALNQSSALRSVHMPGRHGIPRRQVRTSA